MLQAPIDHQAQSDHLEGGSVLMTQLLIAFLDVVNLANLSDLEAIVGYPGFLDTSPIPMTLKAGPNFPTLTNWASGHRHPRSRLAKKAPEAARGAEEH